MRKLFLLFVAFVATTTLWAYDFHHGDLCYNITNDTIAPYTVEVTYQENYSSNNYAGLTTATIPETVTYNGTTYSVTSIGDEAFRDCSSLTSVTIPNSVTSIGDLTFYNCSSLTSITIPESVTSIGYGAFYDTAIYNDESNWENDVLYINNCLIGVKESISGAYTIKENTRLIAGSAFAGCSSLTSITIPNSVTSIGGYAFLDCSSLTSVTIPNSVKSIGDLAFSGCSSLTSITIPNSVTSIGDEAFRNCSSLTSITIPNSVTSIGESAFADCSSLTFITIPNSVTSIGDKAFYNCTKLTSVTWNAKNYPDFSSSSSAPFYDSRSQITNFVFGDSVEHIPAYLCYGMNNLKAITIPNSVTSIGNYAFSDCSSLTSVTIGNSVTSIGSTAFNGCSSLTSITIPNSVKRIGDQAFYYCSSLTSVTIPNSVTSIGDEAFRNCSSLTSVTIGNSVTSIGYRAFENCSSLTSITIGNSVKSIGNHAFRYCHSLTSIVVGTSNTTYDSRDNCNAIIETATNTLITGCQNTTIPNSVTSIGEDAFSDCSSLTSITIPNSVKSIGFAAFADCSSLTSVTIGNSVTSIGRSAFSGCTSLTSIVVGTSNTTYDSRDNCNAIIETATNTLITGCQNTTIPNSVTSIGNGAFSGCSSLTSVTIPNSVKNIGNGAFSGCTSLTSITIPNSVKSIGEGAFSGCTSLISITIPNSVTSIGEGAFSRCWFEKENFMNQSDLDEVEAGYWGANIAGYSMTTIKKDAYAYPERHDGKYKLTNTWVFSNKEDNFAANKPGSNDFVRGMATKDGKMYFINRDLKNIIVVDGATGEMLRPIAIKGKHLFEVQDENGEWKSGCLLPYNDIKFDDAGNCLIGALMTGGATKCQTFFIYIVNLETGVCTKLIEDYLWDNPGLDQVQFRFDAFGAAGDVTKNGVIMAADANTNAVSWDVYRWKITNGVAAQAEKITCDPAGSRFEKAAGFGTAAHISPQDETGSVFYVDGFNTLPMRFNEKGELLGDFINCPYGVQIGNAEGDSCKMNTGHNGLCEFQVKNENFLVMAATNTSGYPSSSFALYKFADEYRSFSEIEPLWYFPANGMGTVTNGCRTAPVSVEVVDDIAYIYLYVNNNGYARYELKVDAVYVQAISSDPTKGHVTGGGNYAPGVETTITANPNYGYYFTRWNDGNTDNPRTVVLTQDTIFTAHFEAQTYILGVVYDSILGQVKGAGTYHYGDTVTLTAVANEGYHFVQWSDGVTDNPRTFTLTQDTTLVAEFAPIISGQCGDNLYWAYDQANKTISITGSGEMYDYTAETQPWLLFKEEIKEVTISNAATTIGTSAFEGCIRLGKVSIGTAMENIAANAFAGCNRLYHIYCYPTYPPFADESSFANYNVYLHVPCSEKEGYDLDIVWGNFKYIECLGAESEPIAPDTIIVTPGTTDVTITWPTEGNADTYTIVIKKDGEVVCTLTFNADGQLLNITFAPGRKGTHSAQYAAETANGLRFTVTGLEEGTNYTYDVITKDKEDNQLSAYSGEFTTYSNTPSDLENLDTQSPKTDCQKLLRDGQLLILKDNKVYTLMGQEIQ